MNDDTRQRKFTRNSIRLNVRLQPTAGGDTPSGAEISGSTRQISMNGLFVECPPGDLAVGTDCRVYLTLADTTTTLEMEARVANRRSSGLGVEFLGMDPESFAHLKRLVLFNASDFERVREEIGNHAGFKNRLDS
ncbi:MAG: PilZ domain-containing protein [Nitrospirota bacterium]|nr:PilZ domain-containing protein [Nitrospirota bacterium]